MHALVQPSLLFMLPSSHCSPVSITPLPHIGGQSLSLFAFAPAGQQPSPLVGIVIGVNTHAAVHVPPFASRSVVHTIMSLQLVGQWPGPDGNAMSQVSPIPGSKIPLPQFGGQSLSFDEFAPGGQQPSSSIG